MQKASPIRGADLQFKPNDKWYAARRRKTVMPNGTSHFQSCTHDEVLGSNYDPGHEELHHAAVNIGMKILLPSN